MGIKQQPRDLDSKWNKTKCLQLPAKQQIQASSVSDMEANLLVELTMDVTTSRGKALYMNSSAREQRFEVSLSESKAHEKAQICVEWVCTMLCNSLALVQMKTSNMGHMGMENYTLCDSRAQVKPVTAMEVVGVMYTEPEVNEQSGPELGEDSARAVRKLIEIFSIKENSLAEEQSRKMKIKRKQDKSLFNIDDITVQISTASAQVKLTTYKKQAMVEIEVEQTDHGAGVFQSVNLDVEAALGMTDLS